MVSRPTIAGYAAALQAPVRRPALFLFLLAGALYLNCLPNQFTQDDFYYIANNRQIRQAPWLLFVQTSGVYLYRPLGMLSYAANYALGGLHPFGFHLVNLLLHAAVTALLYWLLRELLDRPRAALVAALLFAVHPIHTEAVAAAVGRTELLATGFLLSAWLLHLRGRAWPAAFCFLLALLSKESAAAFLVLAPLGDWAYGRLRLHPGGGLLQRLGWTTSYARYVAAFAIFLMLRWNALGVLGLEGVFFLANPLAEEPTLWRVGNALRVGWKYLALQLFPATLSADYSYDAIPVVRSWTALLPAVLGTAGVLGLWGWSFRRHRGVFLALGIYLGGFALTANVLFPIGTVIGERLAYLPSAGLCLLAGLGWEWLAVRRKTAAVVGLAVVVAVLAARTVVRNQDWHDDFTLMASAVWASPESARARHIVHAQRHSLMGVMGDQTRADQFLKSALEHSGRGNPPYDELAITFTEVLIAVRRYEGALEVLDRVIAASPRSSRAYSNRAVARYHHREWEGARADAEIALRLDPADQLARALLARLDQPQDQD